MTKIDYKPRKRAYQNENGDIVNARGRSSTLVNHRGPVEGRGSFFTPRGTKPGAKMATISLVTGEGFEHQDI